MMLIRKKADNHSLAKIILITSAVVLAIMAVLVVLCKLRQKYLLSNDECCGCDDCLDEDGVGDFVEIECEDDDLSDLNLAEGV